MTISDLFIGLAQLSGLLFIVISMQAMGMRLPAARYFGARSAVA